MTLLPAFGRDYSSAEAAKADFYDGKEFVVADAVYVPSTRRVNITGLRKELAARHPFATGNVNIRYQRHAKVCLAKYGQ